MHQVDLPMNAETVKKLRVGDEVLLSGVIYTARDRAHQFLLDENFDKLQNGVIYHCGPIVKNGKIISAGPTTSARMNKFTPDVIRKYGIRAIIGKGGMSKEVIDVLKNQGVYFTAIGGAAVLYADSMKLNKVYKEDFGMPEAIYEIEVMDFPVIVGIDSYGKSLYKDVEAVSKTNLVKLIKD